MYNFYSILNTPTPTTHTFILSPQIPEKRVKVRKLDDILQHHKCPANAECEVPLISKPFSGCQVYNL